MCRELFEAELRGGGGKWKGKGCQEGCGCMRLVLPRYNQVSPMINQIHMGWISAHPLGRVKMNLDLAPQRHVRASVICILSTAFPELHQACPPINSSYSVNDALFLPWSSVSLSNNNAANRSTR
jgi:hypothetical protein